MKHSIKIYLTLLLFSGLTFAKNLNNYLEFYIGADSQIRFTHFKKGFGENLFHKTHPQGNIYVGFKLSDNVNLEIGHESTITRTCTTTLTTDECCLGTNIPESISPIIFKTKLKIKGPHFSLVFAYPLENYPVKFLCSIGISSIKGTAERKTISFSPYGIQSGTTRTMSKHKEALRATISFIKTRKIIIKKDDIHESIYIPTIKLKDSLVYGLGAFWVF